MRILNTYHSRKNYKNRFINKDFTRVVSPYSGHTVYREDIFNCCVRGLRRKNFSPLNNISVIFTDIDNAVSEGAVDSGGPTREMFTLLLKYLSNSMMFEGSNESKNITLYNEHLESRNYYEAGRIIALSLIHGGPSPQFFSKTLFNFLVNGVRGTKPHINEIVNPEIRNELDKIANTRNLAELQSIVTNSAIKYYMIHRTMSALEQFREGLNILQLMDKMKHLKYVLFKIKFSETGSNKRNVESKILSFWKDYLLDCEERYQVYSFICIPNKLTFGCTRQCIREIPFENLLTYDWNLCASKNIRLV
ncbi:hypothetical protein ABEB36_014495 [Hypothenemus hampei]|uniref:HECT domain-containing protein n=1 Tax=Hypothenemus hampei TaxID=57062 RepID=A0ABD1E6M1_HYPHA